jgi:hypothetical protein
MNAGSMSIPRDIPLVQVHTTNGRGANPEELAARCADKLISVADTAPMAIREQAMAFKEHIEKLVAIYMREAIASDRTTVYTALKAAGHSDLAELIRRI